MDTNKITKKMIVDFMMKNPTASAEEILNHNFGRKTLDGEHYKNTQKNLPLHKRDKNLTMARAINEIMKTSTTSCSVADISRQLTIFYGIFTTSAKITAMLKSMYGEKLNCSTRTRYITIPRQVKEYSI